MKRFIILILLLVVCCTEPDPQGTDFITDIIPAEDAVIPANNTPVEIKAILNSSLDQRAILFETDMGTFADSKDGKKFLATAEMDAGQLVARAKLNSPGKPGIIKIKVQPQLTDLVNQYIVERKIKAEEVIPEKLELKANSFQVLNNFDSEIEITGILTNKSGEKVSDGYAVRLTDTFSVSTGNKGAFRNESLKSANSQISATYSPGPIPNGQYVTIIGEILDSNSKVLGTSDPIKIYVSKK